MKTGFAGLWTMRVMEAMGKRMGVSGSGVFNSRIEGKGELSINVVVRADVR